MLHLSVTQKMSCCQQRNLLSISLAITMMLFQRYIPNIRNILKQIMHWTLTTCFSWWCVCLKNFLKCWRNTRINSGISSLMSTRIQTMRNTQLLNYWRRGMKIFVQPEIPINLSMVGAAPTYGIYSILKRTILIQRLSGWNRTIVQRRTFFTLLRK